MTTNPGEVPALAVMAVQGGSSSVLTTEELAAELRTTPATVHWWFSTGKGPRSFKVGRRRLYRRQDVDAWIEAGLTEAAAETSASA